jgi:hypothetical protein
LKQSFKHSFLAWRNLPVLPGLERFFSPTTRDRWRCYHRSVFSFHVPFFRADCQHLPPLHFSPSSRLSSVDPSLVLHTTHHFISLSLSALLSSYYCHCSVSLLIALDETHRVKWSKRRGKNISPPLFCNLHFRFSSLLVHQGNLVEVIYISWSSWFILISYWVSCLFLGLSRYGVSFRLLFLIYFFSFSISWFTLTPSSFLSHIWISEWGSCSSFRLFVIFVLPLVPQMAAIWLFFFFNLLSLVLE